MATTRDYIEARAMAHTRGNIHMDFVTLETMQGYTSKQLQELNELILLQITKHLMDSLYDENGVLDIDGWIADDPTDYQSLCECVIADYDTQIA